MIRSQLAERGVRDPRVLAAMRSVPRHEFVPEEFRDQAYNDNPLPIGEGQTISQPYIVAAMLDHLAYRKPRRSRKPCRRTLACLKSAWVRVT